MVYIQLTSMLFSLMEVHNPAGLKFITILFRFEGENVVSEITFVPTMNFEELTCEAYNEAVSQPVKQTVHVSF